MKRRNFIIAIVLAVLLLGGIVVGTMIFRDEKSIANKSQPPNSETTEKESPKPTFPVIDLQPTVDTWAAAQSADFGITVYDVANDRMVAAHQADKQFLIASVSKLYVAYLTLLDFQTGAQKPDSTATQGFTKKQCVYKMINTSDNPCGDTMHDLTPAAAANNRFKTLGLTNTSIGSYKSTARDSTTLLLRLHNKEDLSGENTDYLLKAMGTQTYRSGLPKGMPDAEVADKVGFYGNHLWHDVGIVTMPNKRVYIVSIFGYQGATSTDIADFGETIYAKLQTEN